MKHHNVKTLIKIVYLTWLCLLSLGSLHPRRKQYLDNLLPCMVIKYLQNRHQMNVAMMKVCIWNRDRRFLRCEKMRRIWNQLTKPNLKRYSIFSLLGLDGSKAIKKKAQTPQKYKDSLIKPPNEPLKYESVLRQYFSLISLCYYFCVILFKGTSNPFILEK